MNRKQQFARQQWLAHYEQLLTDAVPDLSGKVDWDSAIFFFNRGDTAESAAALMAQRWKDHDHD